MNKTVKDYFSESSSNEEKWDNIKALAKSLHSGLQHLLNRTLSYNALLELELEENPTAKIYLDESKMALQMSMSILGYLNTFSKIAPQGLESIELKVLLNAIVKRINKIGKFNIQVDYSALKDEENFIRGNLFLLQQLFFDLPYIIFSNDSDDATTIYMTVEVEKYDDDFFKNRKSSLSSGEFIRITIDDKTRKNELEDFITIFEKLVLIQNVDHIDRLFFLYGGVLEHDGDMFFLKEGQAFTTCAMLLPLQRNQISMYSDSNLKRKKLKGAETILLVDDEDIIWDVVIDMLQNIGYTVILAANGKECVEIYQNNPGKIDLVLLDMVMPELNGHEAFFKLKKLDSNVKVLLSSGYVDEEDARDVLNAGAAGFLQKPYRMLDLAEKVQQILDL